MCKPSGRIEESVYKVVSAASELEEQLIAEGMNHIEAWEQAKQKYKIDPGSDEDFLFYLAESWSINPDKIDAMKLSPRIGIVGKIPEPMLAWPRMRVPIKK